MISEWVIKFNSLFGTADIGGPCSPKFMMRTGLTQTLSQCYIIVVYWQYMDTDLGQIWLR